MQLSKIIQSFSTGTKGERMAVTSAKNCLKCSLLALFLLFFQASFAQSDWSDVDADLTAKQKQLGKNLVMMVWKKDDTLVYKKELGDFNSKTQAPLGSCSKWLTAALVMVLVEEGKFSLDDKVSKWLPEFARYGKNYITLRTCLSHTTGISESGKFMSKIFQRRPFASLEEEVNSYAAKEIRANPTQDFWYGNTGINIAGRVIEVVMKKNFDVVAKQKLFNPLTMRRTTFSSMDGSPVSPSNGAQSTADDYMKFLVMLLNKGQYNGKKILSEESVNTLMLINTQPSMIRFAPKAAQGYSYALGSWVMEEKEGKATALACPDFFGSWPTLDFCRGYASFVMVKSLSDDELAAVHKQLKTSVDGHFEGNCQ